MPATFTPQKTIDIEKKNPGTGGRPPLDRRPTGGGGGDGDNWDNRPHGRRGPRELINRYRIMLLFALAGDLMFFVGLICAFFIRQSSGHIDARNAYVGDWHPITLPSILWINTAVLLLSSFTMEAARRQLFREVDVMDEWLGLGRPVTRRTAPWLFGTLALGGLFLLGQWVAWNQLWEQGYNFSATPAGYFFYLLTGAHAAHLAMGVIALISSVTALYTLKKLEYRQIVVDCSAWYWHFMGGFWLILMALLTYGQ